MTAGLAAPPAARPEPDRFPEPDRGYVAGNVYFALRKGVPARNVEWVAPGGLSLRCFACVPRAEEPLSVVPDLVVEVVSPNDLADDVNRKRVEWLAAGAGLVWVVFPFDQEVHAFPAGGGPVRVFGPADDLTADPVLPGFRTPVADLFRLPAAG